MIVIFANFLQWIIFKQSANNEAIFGALFAENDNLTNI